MLKKRFLILTPLLLLQLSCDVVSDNSARVVNASEGATEWATIEWTELMPDEDLQALLNPPEYLMDVEEGSAEDQRRYEQLASGATSSENPDRYQQALLSSEFRQEFNNRDIRIAGYLVPLEFKNSQLVTQALLVPFFGACIHLPPPPPNQIILLNAPQGIALGELYDPYWLSGRLATNVQESELGTSSYEMDVASYELYTE